MVEEGLDSSRPETSYATSSADKHNEMELGKTTEVEMKRRKQKNVKTENPEKDSGQKTGRMRETVQ